MVRAALADDRPGVTFTAELCVPWDAPEAVVDINSTDLISLGSFPDKVGLFGRRKEAAVSRIMAGRDSRGVRFVVPDGRIQHYRVYKGGLPHPVFRTDYLSRLRSLLPSPGGADTPPDDVCGVTPTSVRRPHRLSRPKRLFSDSVANRAPILTEQNPAEMIGETVIDCRPALLPVSIPLSGLSPETISGARDSPGRNR